MIYVVYKCESAGNAYMWWCMLYTIAGDTYMCWCMLYTSVKVRNMCVMYVVYKCTSAGDAYMCLCMLYTSVKVREMLICVYVCCIQVYKCGKYLYMVMYAQSPQVSK